MKNLIRRLVELDQTKKIKYLKNISSREIEIIEEILVNVIKGNIPLNIKVFKLLKRVKKHMYYLISSKVSHGTKKLILSSLKGLQILNLVLPTLQRFLS